jgi:hypothetical protein
MFGNKNMFYNNATEFLLSSKQLAKNQKTLQPVLLLVTAPNSRRNAQFAFQYVVYI